jgi:hypothetical protein
LGEEIIVQVDTQKPPIPIAQFKGAKDRSAADSIEIVVAKALAWTFWLYLITNTFIFNVDTLLYEILPPWLAWAVKYKILLVLGALIFCLSRFSRAKLIFYPIYFLTFPLAQFVKVLFLLARKGSWSAFISIWNFIFSFFRHLRATIQFIFLFVMLLILSVFVDTALSNIAAFSVAIGLVVLVHYRVIVAAFSASEGMNIYAAVFDKAFENRENLYTIDNSIRGIQLDSLSEKQVDLRNTRLDYSLVHNRLCLFLARRLREYHVSPWRLLPPILSSLALLAWNIVLFAFSYFSLWRAKETEFDLSVPGRFFEFFYFSFNNLIFNSVQEIRPVGDVARVVYLLQVGSVFLIIAVFLAAVVSYWNENFSRQVEEAITRLERSAQQMEDHIRAEFGVEDIKVVIESAEKARLLLLGLVLKLTSRLDNE